MNTPTHYCLPLQTLNLLVIEGPAGSGKTTLIQKLLEDGGFSRPTPVVEFPRPRSYDGTLNLALSLIKDSSSVMSALLHQMLKPDQPTPIIDRWMLSQMVYGRIRRGFNPAQMNGQILDELTTSISMELTLELQLIQQLYHLLISRDGYYQDETMLLPDTINLFRNLRINLMFAVLLPDITLLEAIRQIEFNKSGRRYPYSASQEIGMYQALVEALTTAIRTAPATQAYLVVRPLRYSNLEELTALPTLVSRRFFSLTGISRRT